MIIDRRRWVGLLTVFGISAASAPVSAAPGDAGALTHHVFFWLKRPGNPADRDTLIAGLKTLRSIPQIRALHIGLPAPTEARSVVDGSYDVSELMFFDSVADQKSYQDHPLHKRFVAECEGLWGRVVVYDSLMV